MIAFEWSSAEGVHNLAVLSSAGGVSFMPSTPAKKLITATLDDSDLLLGSLSFTGNFMGGTNVGYRIYAIRE